MVGGMLVGKLFHAAAFVRLAMCTQWKEQVEMAARRMRDERVARAAAPGRWLPAVASAYGAHCRRPWHASGGDAMRARTGRVHDVKWKCKAMEPRGEVSAVRWDNIVNARRVG